MEPSTPTVLAEVVDRYRESGDPVSRATLADALRVPEESLSGPVDALCACDLLAATDGGYRPTVTARELLARDIDVEDVVVVEVVDE